MAGDGGGAGDGTGGGAGGGGGRGRAAAGATLRKDLRRVAAREDTSDPPQMADYDAHGEWSASTAVRRLGGDGHSWADALDAAGLDGAAARERGPGGGPDEAALRADLREVAARGDTSDPPTTADYDAHGEWAAQTVADRLGDGSWADALDDAGLDGDAARGRGRGTVPDEAALRRDLREVAARDDTSDPPTQTNYRAHGAWSVLTAAKHLGGEGYSWADALDAAGLDGAAARERGPEGAPDEAALRRDLREVAARDDTSDPPTTREYEDHGEWSAATVAQRLGGDSQSWADALDDAGLDGDAARGRGRGTVPDEAALRRDLREVAARDNTSDPPTTREYEDHGEWSAVTAAKHLGGEGESWADALDDAGLDGATARDRGPGEAAGGAPPADLDALREDLRRVAARGDTSDPPTTADYDAHGEWEVSMAARRLGGDGQSWAAALDAAGLDGDAASERWQTAADADGLREDLRRVAARDDTRDPPTVEDYRDHGEWAATTARQRLGDEESWPGALDAAGLDGDAARDRIKRPGRRATDPEALRADLRRVAAREDTSDPPTKADYEAHGEWAASTTVRRLGGDGHSWADALDAAGLDGDAVGSRGQSDRAADLDALREDVRRVAAREDTHDPPSRADYDDHGEWSSSTAAKRLGGGSWRTALNAVGVGEGGPGFDPGGAAGDGGDGGDGGDSAGGIDARGGLDLGGGGGGVAAATGGTGGDAPDEGDLREDLRRVAARDDTADPPTAADYEAHGEWSTVPVRWRLGDGSWADALDAAGLGGGAAD